MAPAPPVGIEPKSIRDANRLIDLSFGIIRFSKDPVAVIPWEWRNEVMELIVSVNEHRIRLKEKKGSK